MTLATKIRSLSPLTWLVVGFMMLPLVVIVPVSFTPERFLSFPTTDWSLRHFAILASDAGWRNSIITSIVVGLLSAGATTAFATLFCVGLWYRRPSLTPVLIGAVLTPMVVPPIISAVAMYFFTTDTKIFDTMTGVVIAHMVIAAPYAVVSLLVALSQVDRRILLAAQNMGAGLWQTTYWVVLPNIRFGMISAAFMAFIVSWEEISVTLFVTSVKISTLPRKMWAGLRDNVDPAIAAVSVVLIAMTVLVLIFRILRDLRRPAV